MAEKNEEVTLKSVFSDLASQLKDAITSSGGSEEEPETKPKTDEELAAEAKTKEEAEAKEKADAEAKAKADKEAAASKGDGEEGDKPEFAAKADVEAIAADLATIKELLTAEDGDFRTSLGNLVKTATTHGEALEKVIARLEKLEGNTAVSKSIEGDDSGGDENEEGDKPNAGLTGLTKAVTYMARNPKGAPVGPATS